MSPFGHLLPDHNISPNVQQGTSHPLGLSSTSLPPLPIPHDTEPSTHTREKILIVALWDDSACKDEGHAAGHAIRCVPRLSLNLCTRGSCIARSLGHG